jgi:hypothetical protein
LHDYKEYDQNGVAIPDSFKSAQAKSVVAPTCMRQGYTVYSCTVCQGEDFKDNYTDIDLTNHNISSEPAGTTVPETCIKHAYNVHACTNTAEDGTTCPHAEERIVGTTYADHQFADGEPTGVITCTYCQKSFYDTTYVETKYNDGETEWDDEETEFDDDTSLNVTITVSKAVGVPMELTNTSTSGTQVDAEHTDVTEIAIIRVITENENVKFTVTVNAGEANAATYEITGGGYIDLVEYTDEIKTLTVASTGAGEYSAAVHFYGEKAIPATSENN